jgi:hypothetical protein
MQTIRKLLILLSIFILSVNGSIHSQEKKIDFTSQWDTVRVLKNPNKGWYHHLLDNGITKYAIKDDSIFASFPGMDHIYLRLAWSYLEPKEGEFDWSYIDRVVEKYVPRGYKISFRISCSETGKYPGSVGEQVDGVQYATPSWVEKAGAKGTITAKGKSWVPEWDDPVFLAKLDQFHKAFAARYDSKPWVSYVDIGSIGDWGEGHTAFTTKVPPTVSEAKAHIDLHLKNYKKSILVVNDELLFWGKPDTDKKTILSYLESKGLTLRDDGILVGWWVKNVPKVLDSYTVLHPELFDPLYLKKPIVLEFQHYGSVKNDGNWLGKNGETIIPGLKVSGADILCGAIKTMHATYIGYHGYAEDWLKDNPDLTKCLANLCGYWYFPVKATIPGKMVIGENFISIEWLNKGVAPAYNVFTLILHFEAKKPENSFDLFLEDSGNKNWLPDIVKVERYLIAIPPKTPKGQYKLSFKLVDQANEMNQDIQLGLKEKAIGNQGFIYLGNVSF